MKTINKKYTDVKNPDAEILDIEMKNAIPDISLMNILIALISDKSNLELKTEIHRPKEFSIFELFGKYLISEKYKEASEPIIDFCRLYRENMVSFKRGSRKEIEKILSSWIEKYQTDKQGNLLLEQRK